MPAYLPKLKEPSVRVRLRCAKNGKVFSFAFSHTEDNVVKIIHQNNLKGCFMNARSVVSNATL